MATEKQLKAIKIAQKKKAANDLIRAKANKYDALVEAFTTAGYSFNLRQRRLVQLRNEWPELFTALKENIGLNPDDSSVL